MRPTPRHPRRASSLAIAATAGLTALLSACGVDQGVSLIASEQVPVSEAPAPPPATTVPDTPDEPSTEVPTTEAPAELPDVPPPTSPTGSTLPPISEPELLTQIDIADVVDVDENKPERSYDAFVAVAFTDIQRWWGEQYPAVFGEPFEPLAGGIYAGYPERQSSLPGCDDRETTYPDLNQFVAFYCSGGDFMIYDDGDDSLLAALTENFGPAVMGVVLAHEYGHAIQARTGALGQFLATIYTEQQADCFSGAWTGQAYRGESPLLRLGDADVRAGLIAMLEVRDPVGTNQFEEGGHGSAFDRVGAFQEGFVKGATRCAELIDDPLPLMPNEFQTQQDFNNQGNAPYSCPTGVADCTPAPVFLADDLNDFWASELDGFPTVTVVTVDNADGFDCSGFVRLTSHVALCADADQVVYVEPDVVELYNEFGDFTLGYFYGIAWAERAQILESSALSGETRALLDDCYTGAWVANITPDETGATPRQRDTDGDGVLDGISSSPGDLDEAIRMAVLFGDAGSNVNVAGSAFEKIAAFRVGVLGGLDACRSRFSA